MTGGAVPAGAPITVDGWSIYAHPLFLEQLEELIAEVEARKERDPDGWHRKNPAKRLAAIFKLVTTSIPADPGAPAFRQGDSLGDERKHWFRAKFFQQYRLFYRFNSDAKIIVLAWVNGEKTLRAYGKKTDAYAVFKSMLEGGHPPDDFERLKQEALAAAPQFAEGLRAGRER
jgi:toxin YhaV